jgi:branched-chain amino acid transport system substrate-binding protein
MINETGGVGGCPVELVTGDASTPDKAQSEAERLSSLAGLQVITGAYYAASRVIERRGGLYWEPAASPTD